ncbi:hypothetical protein QFZ87_000261 [Bacillus sp. SLBN-46]|uniref:hypothetical protein n=1 Tax=Bacillus sp. SLBN-46 TaxID=3042283 RepID=UPI002860CD0E|nr:hypothetical protein [Bacillus sp. SLBN-46]MDR6120664.1 hypothetical protein [Bacillus sp. SLBN-46]
MNISYNFSVNLIELVGVILSWGIIGFIAYRINKRKLEKSKAWKIMVCVFIGIFSFSINWNFNDTPIKIAILPLGVWILYWFLKSKEGKWERYRSFAWLGFWANFIFLATALLSIPIHHVVYPENELSTYIFNVEDASVISTHPSAKEQLLDKESLEKQLHTMKPAANHGIEWYNEIEMESTKKSEKFPYQLIGFSPKWGSNLNAVIYIEADGKGLLVSTPKKQLYFRSQESLLRGGN